MLGKGNKEAILASALVGASIALIYGFAKALKVSLPFYDLSFAVTVLASLIAFLVIYTLKR